MIFLRSAIVVLIFGEISECLRLDSTSFKEFQSHDGARYPMLKVAYYDPKIAPKRVKKGEVRQNIFIPGGKSANLRNEHVDNVRLFAPMSREDIKRMKKLSFHGRSSPRAQRPSRENETSTENFSENAPVQLNFQERKYTGLQQARDARKSPSSKETSSESFSVKYDGFLPSMRSSPINVSPVDPQSFKTVRNYVDLLKSRQKGFFSDVIEDTQPTTTEKSPSEVDYFIKRERELVEEQRPRNEHKNIDHVEVVEPIIKEQQYEHINHDEEESKRHESFVPYKLYAQVRHVEAERHRPKFRAETPRPKEKLTLEKKNVYYKEEGYLDKDYDHGDEVISSRYRSKRDVENAENLPVALAHVKNSDYPLLTGEKLLKHLDELLKNSSIYLPDEDDEDDAQIRKNPAKTIYGGRKNLLSHKYPYYNLPDTDTLNTMSAFRYSENIKNFPREKQSLYNFKRLDDCEEIDQEVDPVPDDIEEEGKSTTYNKSPQRLKNLGGKIGCYKEKIFGKDPFDNPLFKEKQVSVPIPILSHQANPLITVYDDVISNIRAAFADELKSKQELKLKQEEGKTKVNDAVASSSSFYSTEVIPDIEITDLSSAPVTPRLPLFDINTFYPKLKIPLSDEVRISPAVQDKDIEIEYVNVPLSRKKPKKNSKPNNLPNAPQQATELVIKNLRPPNLAQEKRWRPNSYEVTRALYPYFHQPPSTNFRLF